MKLPPFPKLPIAPYVAVAILGFTIAIVASDADPGPRLSKRERLVDLIAREDDRSRTLRAQLDDLQERIRALEERAGRQAAGLSGLQAEIDELGLVAGLTPVAGPGLVVELRDSALRQSPSGDPNDLVIHEQDLQAVVNALWGGGAEAVAINGERITATSAVRCVGNTLLLHGSVYAPPYRVEAVGDAAALSRSLDRNPLVARFRIYAEDFQLGFDVGRAPRLELPAFRGVVATTAATRA